MNYSEQLETLEWRRKRNHILKRDHYTCALCGKKLSSVELNVHHKHYALFRMAWEYDDDDLITLCEKCHQHVHENNTMPVYLIEKSTKYLAPLAHCPRCDGTGYLPQFERRDHGICYKCMGTGYHELAKGDIGLLDLKSKITRPSISFLKQIKEVTVVQHKEITRPEAIIVFKNGKRSSVLFDFNNSAVNGDKIRLGSIRWIEYHCDLPEEERVFLTGEVKPQE